MGKFFFVFFILTVQTILSSEQISDRYSSGPYLIFDCLNLHYVCVDFQGHNSCTKEWKSSLKQKKLQAECMPVETFKTKNQCIKKQQILVNHSGDIKDLCTKVFNEKFFGRQ